MVDNDASREANGGQAWRHGSRHAPLARARRGTERSVMMWCVVLWQALQVNCVPELVSTAKICPQCSADRVAEQRFYPPDSSALEAKSRAEAASAACISHPKVVSTYEFGETADGLILVAYDFEQVVAQMGRAALTVPSPAAGRRSIDEIRLGSSGEPAGPAAAVSAGDCLLPELESRAEIAEALYYQAAAQAAQDDRAGACDGFRRAASSGSGRLLTAGNVALEVCQ